ncbi:MAG: hypothetical protein WCL27_04950 [Betaproteobacteria bacterium]
MIAVQSDLLVLALRGFTERRIFLPEERQYRVIYMNNNDYISAVLAGMLLQSRIFFGRVAESGAAKRRAPFFFTYIYQP